MFMRAVHPGEILKDELDELDITPTEFARQIDVSRQQARAIDKYSILRKNSNAVYSTSASSGPDGQTGRSNVEIADYH